MSEEVRIHAALNALCFSVDRGTLQIERFVHPERTKHVFHHHSIKQLACFMRRGARSTSYRSHRQG